MFLRIVFSCVLLLASKAEAVTFKGLITDAEARLVYGDFFQSYRIFGSVELDQNKSFGALGVEGFLKSLFIIGAPGEISAECKRLSASPDNAVRTRAGYVCGLNAIEKRKPIQALEYLRGVAENSGFHWPAQILRATAYLVQNEFQKAMALLPESESKKFVAAGLGDQYYLCRARALVAQNRFEDALRDFQAVASESPLYIEALEETSWVFFKLRRFESAQVLLDVLIGNFESARRGPASLIVSPNAYFRSRYLKAYMALLEQRTEGASAEFADLKGDYEKFKEKTMAVLDPAKALEVIGKGNGAWTDVRNIPENVKGQLDLVAEWLGPEIKKNLESQIYLQMALSREAVRIKRQKNLVDQVSTAYATRVANLQQMTWKNFSDEYRAVMGRVGKSLKKGALKAELGRLEIVWMNRAQGARNLDEIIDNYQAKMRSVDESMGQ